MCLNDEKPEFVPPPSGAAGKDNNDANAASSPPWPDDDAAGAGGTSQNGACRRRRRRLCAMGLPSRRVRATFDRWTYSYMNRVFAKGALQRRAGGDGDARDQARITKHDLYATPLNDEASMLNAKFWDLYARTNGNFARTIWRLAAPTFVPGGFCQLVALGCQLSVPLCVMRLLQAVERSYADAEGGGNLLQETIAYVLLIFLLAISNAWCTQRYLFLSYRSGIVIRTAVTSAIYQHSLRLSPRGREGLTSGNITNLVATDTQKLFEVMQDGHMIWSAPIAIVIVASLLFLIIGPSCLIGAAILVGLVPLSKKVSQSIVGIRKKRVAVADERIEIITAMLSGIKVTKLNNYEDKFESRVAEAREREMGLVQREQFVWGHTLVIRVFTPVVASFATFMTYVLVSEDHIMTASVVFTLSMLFNMLKFPINQAGQLLSKAAVGAQAMQRIAHFISLESRETVPNSAPRPLENDDDDVVLEVKAGEFYVGCGSDGATEACEDNPDSAGFTLSGVDFDLKRGEVLAVVGEVASGKTTLIQSLLGDTRSSDETDVSIRGNVSVAGQSPFILSNTVRENILFGAPFDADRYSRVLDACCLRADLLQWPAGDLTEIGERGVTMSGGQKQRVSVARAVYCNSDVVLFDDILSALDSGTSKRLFQNLFETVEDESGLLHTCGVVLVTHAANVLQRVSKILVLDAGECIFYGTWASLQSFQPQKEHHNAKIKALRLSLQHDAKEEGGENLKEEKSVAASVAENDADAQKGEIMTKEERDHGKSSPETWLLWFKYAGGLGFILVQIFLMACDRGSYVLIDYWLATWSTSAGQSINILGMEFPNQYDGISAQSPYLIVYTSLVGVMLVFLVLRTQWMIRGGIRACRRMFSNMTTKVLHAPMSYFDTTPLGRLLNRFTFDVEQTDITLSQFMSIFIIATSWLIAGQIVMISVVPWMAFINGVVLLIYLRILHHYRWSASDLQRLDAVSRSPIQASLAEGLDGTATIRAYRRNDYFLDIFQGYINDNSSAMLNFVSSRRWLAVRLESLGAFVTLSACLFIITMNEQLGLSPGLAGFLIVWATSMTTTLSFLINAFSEAEAAITSIERMHAIEMLPQERSMVTSSENTVDKLWPRRGDLDFRGVKLRYRPELPLSLDGLTFNVQHGERVAIVGRTGAGKSTVATALFRLVEIEEGRISLDGVDLSTLGLSDVRGREHGMFILPQDPAIFAGTIRSNIDPFTSHPDEDMVNALRLVRFPGSDEEGTGILQVAVDENGSNFSGGEKQLLMLARAMLAHPKLLLLDEATSAVDGTTDDFVQQMLRTHFKDTTLLTIAHRLNTIIDYDVVIVMANGKVKEIGPPRELLENEEGVFTAMVNATGKESAAQLKRVANKESNT